MNGDDGLYAALVRRGMSRRSFLRFSAAITATLALPAAFAPRIARAVETAPRIPVIWLRGQTCGGNTEALTRTADPSVSSMLLDVLSVEYHQSLLAVAGSAADHVRTSAMERYPGGYLAIVEGAIPTGADGAYCLVGGRPLRDVAREVSDGAQATIALGSCAFDGGAPAAAGGVTSAGGAGQVVTNGQLVSLPGCPMNVVNLAATIVHHLALGKLPPTDLGGRPLFAYGALIHNQCERRPHFEFGEFAVNWGDEGAQKGWCLYKLGCKGPETMANCPTVRYGDGVSWNVRAGAGCIGCTTPHFWDAMLPAYKRLGSPVPFLPNLTVDQTGAVLVGGIGGVAVLHGAGMTVREHRRNAAERRAAEAAAKRHATAEARLAEEAAEPARETILPASGGTDGEPPAGPASVAPGPGTQGTTDAGAARGEDGGSEATRPTGTGEASGPTVVSRTSDATAAGEAVGSATTDEPPAEASAEPPERP